MVDGAWSFGATITREEVWGMKVAAVGVLLLSRTGSKGELSNAEGTAKRVALALGGTTKYAGMGEKSGVVTITTVVSTDTPAGFVTR
jgi:hypothetical protein